MIQPPFSFAIAAPRRYFAFLATKTAVRKNQENNGQTGSPTWTRQCLCKGGEDFLAGVDASPPAI